MENKIKGSNATILIILLIIVSITAIILNNNTLQTDILKPSVQAPIQVITKKVGDNFTLWNIEYKVASASVFKPIYPHQKTEGKYIGVKIVANNLGKTEAGLNRVYIKDNKDRRYESTIVGYRQLGVTDYGMEKAQAGIAKTYGIIFEVAKDSTGLKLEYPSGAGDVVVSVDLGL